jgi:hypothetical protein
VLFEVDALVEGGEAAGSMTKVRRQKHHLAISWLEKLLVEGIRA